MEKEKNFSIKLGCDRGLCHQAVGRQDRQLNTYDWLADVPGNTDDTDLVEVQFKHTRKGYYHNVNNLPTKKKPQKFQKSQNIIQKNRNIQTKIKEKYQEMN